jgi:hypothetical protein
VVSPGSDFTLTSDAGERVKVAAPHGDEDSSLLSTVGGVRLTGPTL